MREILLLIAIGACGAVGAIVRYLVSVWASQWTGVGTNGFPIATLLVNVTGCFLLGALVSTAEQEGLRVSPTVGAALGAGFLGALTTFSTFGVETYVRLVQGQWNLAAANVVGNLLLGLCAVWLGHCLVQNLLA